MRYLRAVPLGALLLAALGAFACGDGGEPASPGPTPFAECLQPVPALTQEPITEEAFEAADDALSRAAALADEGDVSGARAAYIQFLDPRTLAHNVDEPLRRADEGLAVRLCNEVVILEDEFVGARDPSVVAEQARKIRELLGEAQEVLDADGQ